MHWDMISSVPSNMCHRVGSAHLPKTLSKSDAHTLCPVIPLRFSAVFRQNRSQETSAVHLRSNTFVFTSQFTLLGR